MTITKSLFGISLLAWMLCLGSAFGQNGKNDPFAGGDNNPFDGDGGGEPKLTLKVYRVADLFTPRPDYPYRGGIPTTDEFQNNLTNPQPMGGSGVGTGGGVGAGGFGDGGGGGGGFFQVPDPIPRMAQFGGNPMGFGGGGGEEMGMGIQNRAAVPTSETSLRFTLQELRGAIMSTVLPDSWDELGGDAVCQTLGSMLLIKQTDDGHKQIEKLLSDIRTEGGSLHTVTIHATWLLLSRDDAEKLSPKDAGDGGMLGSVDPAVLKDLTANNLSHQAQMSCYNDQTVHTTSGYRRSLVVNAVPTVGFGSLGYSPVVSVPNLGLLLQVRPTVDPDRKSAVLNVTSTMTRWEDDPDPIVLKSRATPTESKGVPAPGIATEIAIDRVNLNTQHLGTTVRMPVGKPVLIGGMSTPQKSTLLSHDDDKVLYLVIQLTAGSVKAK